MDWLRSEDLKEEKNVTVLVIIIAAWGTFPSLGDNWLRGVALSILRINPEYLEPDAADRSVTADLLLCQEPDEDENEEEDEGDDKEEDDDAKESDNGYSELGNLWRTLRFTS